MLCVSFLFRINNLSILILSLEKYYSAVTEAKDLIRHLLVVDKKVRFTAIDLLCHQWIITVGGSKELPTDFPSFQANLRDELVAKGRENLAEWRENRSYVFANSTHNTSTSQL